MVEFTNYKSVIEKGPLAIILHAIFANGLLRTFAMLASKMQAAK